MSIARIALGLARRELALAGIGAILLAGVAGLIVLQAAKAIAPCPGALAEGDCQGVGAPLLALQARSGTFFAAATAYALAAGIMIGVPVVASAIEDGTAAWTFAVAPARLRWLSDRLVPAAVVIAVATAVLGLVTDGVAGSLDPGVGPYSTFDWLGQRGVVLVGYALAGLSIGLLCGALFGRVLPALLLAAFLAGALLFALNALTVGWLDSSALPLGSDAPPRGSLLLSDRQGMPTYVPGSRYGEAVLIQTGLALAVAVSLLSAGSAVLVRRRPD